MYWFRNGKYITPNQMGNYKYYDPSIKGYRILADRAESSVKANSIEFNDVHNPVYMPYYDRLGNELGKKQSHLQKREVEQNIPLKNQPIITLRTKGKMNLADIPLNMLDSIAVNAGRSGTDFWTDTALIGKESTFGGLSHKLGRDAKTLRMYEIGLNPHSLTNNHAYFITPEEDYSIAANKKLYNNGVPSDNAKVKAEQDVKYAYNHGLIKGNTNHYSDYILADAFKRYNNAPNKYNPGQKNYVQMLNNIKQELQGEKQLQNYWNIRGKFEYNRGKKERNKRSLEEGGK